MDKLFLTIQDIPTFVRRIARVLTLGCWRSKLQVDRSIDGSKKGESVGHDLSQQTEYLRAALEQEKKPLGFLIGAGAPMSITVDDKALIPGLEALTDLVRNDIDEPYAAAVGTLVAHLPEADRANLEELLNYVRSLASLPGNEDIRGISVEVLSELDTEICRLVRLHVDQDLPKDENAYQALALWISAMRRLVPTQIFTTNYDLLMEQALERQRVAYFDGFMGSREPIFDLQAIEEDELPVRWTLLWKLHGSINWSEDGDGNVLRRASESNDDSAALVYPSHLKYDQSRRLPYLAMMDRLKSFLRKPGAIIVTCGYSFRDQHINEVIDQSLRINPTATVQALLFGSMDQYEEAVQLASELPNLIVLARDSAVVGSIHEPWSLSGDPTSKTANPSECTLGDFKILGELLRSLVGELPAISTHE